MATTPGRPGLRGHAGRPGRPERRSRASPPNRYCGSRGYGPARRVLLGGVSTRLVRRACRPQ
ncbi:universal stress protein [Paractinoplanes hotanensis]|uniref:Universal stress protein n=1 Tax=Paractinoplanes hotanensis TaxID=2906497 RepID=A0ABT0Y124_9ACTN|nr:universal stress protein [Actinoplanes hotanensis]MCM4079726.1 universal stress protein [Actinoplanes hotanensis]